MKMTLLRLRVLAALDPRCLDRLGLATWAIVIVSCVVGSCSRSRRCAPTSRFASSRRLAIMRARRPRNRLADNL